MVSQAHPPTHRVTVEEAQVGMRLDKFLSEALPQFTRSRVQQLIAQGLVSRAPSTIATNPAAKIKPGDIFFLIEPHTAPTTLTPESIPLDIIFEDDDLIVINKPAGMTVHPAPGAATGTLVHALLAHCGASLSGIGGVARPGIVHRIDKDTTGLLVVAKHDAAHQHLSAQLKDRTLKRRYIALCWGTLTPRAGVIEAPLARHPTLRKQMAVVETGRYARTHYVTEQVYPAPGSITPLASRMTVELDTGRTHQIRIHMAHRKSPLIGDRVYGVSTATRLNRLRAQGVKLPEALLEGLHAFQRQALHAAELSLIHPKNNEEMSFSAPLPSDMKALENCLAILTKPTNHTK